MRQPSNEKRAEWITDWIKLIIKKYQQNHEICERVIDLMPIFFSYVKPHFRSEWHAVVAILITSFFKQAKMRKYGPNVVIKIVNMAKYLAQVRTGLHIFENMKLLNIVLIQLGVL